MKKLLNGVLVDMAPADETALQAERAAFAAAAPARAAAAARVAAVDDQIAQDATVQLLKGMTVAEFDAWWAANVTNAAQISNVLKRVTRVVLRRVL